MARNKEKYNAYLKEYMLRRWHRRREAAIEKLGGACVKCGSKDKDTLQFDHIDPKTKLFTLAKRPSASESLFQAELAKCQLVCEPCHSLKTITDRGMKVAKGNHGTISTRRYCACTLCVAAKTEYMRQRRAKLKRATSLDGEGPVS